MAVREFVNLDHSSSGGHTGQDESLCVIVYPVSLSLSLPLCVCVCVFLVNYASSRVVFPWLQADGGLLSGSFRCFAVRSSVLVERDCLENFVFPLPGVVFVTSHSQSVYVRGDYFCVLFVHLCSCVC